MHSPASVQTQQRSPAGISTALVRPEDIPVVSGPEPLSQSGARGLKAQASSPSDLRRRIQQDLGWQV